MYKKNVFRLYKTSYRKMIHSALSECAKFPGSKRIYLVIIRLKYDINQTINNEQLIMK